MEKTRKTVKSVPAVKQSPSVTPGWPKIILTGELIKSALLTYRENWQKFARLLIIPLVISYLFSLVSFILANFRGKFSWPWPIMLIGAILAVVIMIAMAVLYVLTYISEYLLLKDLSQEVSFKNLGDWYRRAKSFFWISIAVSIIYAILSIIGLVLLIVPGIIFGVLYSFTIFAVIIENHTFEGAFGRSRELVRGYWWAVFGRFLAGGALVYVFYLIIGGIFACLAWLVAYLLHLPSSKELFSLIYDLLSIFVGIIVGPLTMIYGYKIYQSLRQTKNI